MRFRWAYAHTRIRAREDDGAAAVEFALVLIPLLIIVMGVIGFGIVFSQKQALESAARDLARNGVVTYTSGLSYTRSGTTYTGCNALVQMAKDQATTIGMSGDNVSTTVKRGTTTVCSNSVSSTTSPCTGSSETGTGAQLTVNITYSSSVDIFISEPTFNLKGTGTFRCEYTQ